MSQYDPPSEPPPSYSAKQARNGSVAPSSQGPSSQGLSQQGQLTPYDHPAYSQDVQISDRNYAATTQPGMYGNNVQPYYQNQGMYYQQQPGMYYQQGYGARGYGQGYGPGYYGPGRASGGAGGAEAIMAGCLGALAVCCCLDFLF